MTDDTGTSGEAQGQQQGQTDAQQPEQGQDAPKPAPPTGGQQQGDNDQQQKAAEKVEDLPEWAQKIIADTRKEAGDHRAAAKKASDDARQQLAQEIGKAIGLIKGEEPADPDKLAADLTTAQDQQRQTAVELAVYKTASKHDGDPDALLDSRTFLAKVKDLDPSADDFQTKVGEAITSALADNPKLKAARAAGKGGAEFTGGTGEGAITQEKFDAMTYQQRAELYQSNPNVYRQLAGTAAKE